MKVTMNYTPLKIYRFIPLGMFFLCLLFGIYNLGVNSPDNFIAGHVVIFLGAVCLTIFCVASIITGQIIHGGKNFDNIFYPLIGFVAAIITLSYGMFLLSHSLVFYKVAGHKVVGLGLICLCIATEAAVCTRFINISQNSRLSQGSPGFNRFSKRITGLLILIPVTAVIVGWGWVIYLLMNSNVNDNFIPGHVVAGMTMICTCVLVAVVNSIKQINNTYNENDKKIWPIIAFIMGLTSLLWGVSLLVIDKNPAIYLSPGLILIGISCVCFSIFSKMLLTSRSWRAKFPQAAVIPFIPLFLFLSCLFLSFFVFQDAVTNPNLFIPARVLVGLGSVCFSLYAVVSILELINSKN